MIVASIIKVTDRIDFLNWLEWLPWNFSEKEKSYLADKAKVSNFVLWMRGRKGGRFKFW